MDWFLSEVIGRTFQDVISNAFNRNGFVVGIHTLEHLLFSQHQDFL